MWSWLRARRRQRLLQSRPLSGPAVTAALRELPLLARLEIPRRHRLVDLATLILAEKDFIGGGDYRPEAGDCLRVALLAAQPLLGLDLDWYRGFRTFILYPDEYLADVSEMDEAGVLHTGRDLRAGEAWAGGPVVLSLTDIAASGRGEGYNVVAHELAHQLDTLNGDADGFPPLHRGMSTAAWEAAFSAGYRRLLDDLESGRGPWLDPYAAENPAEFFAVCCECYFDVPDDLAEADPAIHDQLTAFFNPPPRDQARRHD